MKKLAMKSLGDYAVWLRGSRKTIHRCIYTDGEKCYCIYYDQVIEVKHSTFDYVTVEAY